MSDREWLQTSEREQKRGPTKASGRAGGGPQPGGEAASHCKRKDRCLR